MREMLIELIGSTEYGNGLVGENFQEGFIAKIADHLIANGVVISNLETTTMQKWISVKDRLPSKEEYTAKAEDGTEYYVRLLIAYKTDIVEYEIGYYDGYKWMTEMPIRLIKDVVAWMPFPNMPQPPKEGADNGQSID